METITPRMSKEAFVLQANSRFATDPMRIRIKSRPDSGRVVFSDTGKTEIVFPILETVPPDNEILHEYGQARAAAKWVDDFIRSEKEGTYCRNLPFLEPYQPKVNLKYNTQEIREVYMVMCKKERWVPDKEARDNILDVLKDRDFKGDSDFCGMVDYEEFAGINYSQLQDWNVATVLKAEFTEDPDAKRPKIGFQFNPFSMLSAKRIRSMESRRVRFRILNKKYSIIVFFGKYEYRDRLYNFCYPLDTKLYRINYETWSKSFDLWCTDLAGFDLVSYSDFWKRLKVRQSLKSWYPQLYFAVDPVLVERFPEYDIVNDLGRRLRGSGYVMCAGTAGIANISAHAAFSYFGYDENFSLMDDPDGPIVMLKDELSKSMLFVTSDKFKGKKFRHLRECDENYPGRVPDLVRVTYDNGVRVYMPRNFANFTIKGAVRDNAGVGYIAFDGVPGPVNLFESFYPTPQCAYNDERCFMPGSISPLQAVSTVASMARDPLFRSLSIMSFDEITGGDLLQFDVSDFNYEE